MQTTKQIAGSITNHNSPWSFVLEYIYFYSSQFQSLPYVKNITYLSYMACRPCCFCSACAKFRFIGFWPKVYLFLTSSSMYFRKGFSIESRYNSVSKPTSFVILLTWLVLYFYSLTSVYYKSLSSINNICHTCKAFETHSGL